MTRALGYLRVSSKAQEEGAGRDTQERDIRARCERNGYELVGFTQDTYTGHADYVERDGLEEARERIRNGDIDVLIVWKIDRSGREQIETMLLHKEITDKGGWLESVIEGKFGDSVADRMMLSIFAGFAEMEWDNIRLRTRNGIADRVHNKGRILATGTPLYGYIFAGEKKSTLDIDPDAAETVRRMFALADAGESTRGIAEWLNEQGIPTPSLLRQQRGEWTEKRPVARKWRFTTVQDILKNVSYTGEHPVFRYETWKVPGERIDPRTGRPKTVRHRRKRTEGVVTHTIPPLVDRATFARVQAKLHNRQLEHLRDQTEEDTVLLNRGIAHCACCGAKMVKNKRHGTRVYVCPNRSGTPADPAKTCPGIGYAVPTEACDADVWRQVFTVARDNEHLKRVVQDKLDTVLQRLRDYQQREESIAAQLKQCQEDAENLLDSIARQRETLLRAALEEKLARVLKEKEDLTAQMGKRERALRAIHATAGMFQEVKNIAQNATTIDSREERRRIMEALGVVVYLYPTNPDIPTVYPRPNDGTRWQVVFEKALPGIPDEGNDMQLKTHAPCR